MTKSDLNELNEFPSETFMDIARICVKKQNKGPFDQLVTHAYRIRMLVEYYPKLDNGKSDKTKLLLLITKGLKFKNFLEFKTECSNYQNFSELKTCSALKDFYEMLLEEANQTNSTIETYFLKKIFGIIQESYFDLDFLKTFVDKQIEDYEKKLRLLTKQT